MNICLISGTYPNVVCGVGFHCYFLAETLASLGHRVSVITTQSNVIPHCLLTQPNPLIYPLISYGTISSWFAARKVIEAINPDVINIHLPVRTDTLLSVLAFPILRYLIRSKPVILTLHEFSEGLWMSKVRGILLIHVARYVIFPNLNDYNLAMRVFPRRSHDFFHAPLGPTLLFPRNIEDIGERDRYSIAYLGILHPRKGLETLLRSMSEVVKAVPQIYLHILSSFDDTNRYHLYVQGLAERLGVGKNIKWYKDLSLSNIAEILIRCNITCLPYPKGATFRHSTLLEALTAGTAVITTKTSRTPPDLIHGHNVWFVRPEDPHDLAQAIVRLIMDDSLTDELRIGGMELSKQFSWTIIGEKITQIYSKIINDFQNKGG